MLAIYGPYISDFLAFAPIMVADWLFILGAAAIYLLIFEGLKLFKRIKSSSQKNNLLTKKALPSLFRA